MIYRNYESRVGPASQEGHYGYLKKEQNLQSVQNLPNVTRIKNILYVSSH